MEREREREGDKEGESEREIDGERSRQIAKEIEKRIVGRQINKDRGKWREREKTRHDRETQSLDHVLVHHGAAIHVSQEPTSPIGFLSLKLPPPPCAVLLVLYVHGTYYCCTCVWCLSFFTNSAALHNGWRLHHSQLGLRHGLLCPWLKHSLAS